MTKFTLDTSGEVRGARLFEQPDGSWRSHWAWSDLDAFTQGYVEAALASLVESTHTTGWAFRYLAPETLAAMLEFCAKHPNAQPHKHPGDHERQRRAGRYAWEDQQPRRVAYLGDDGKVYLREASKASQ